MRAIIVGIFVFVAASVLVAMNLRRAARPVSAAAADVAQESPPTVEPMKPATKLPIELIGTIVRMDAPSIATIRVAQHERENVSEKTLIEKLATVTRIERERVYFLNLESQQEEYVRIRPYDPSQAVSPQSMSAAGEKKEFQIQRSEVDQQLQNLPQLLMTARAVPVTDATGKIRGFKIESMDESSFFNELGLHPGDTITDVNGTKLESVEGVVKLFNQLRDSSMVQLKVSRGARDLDLTYLIR